MKTKLATIGRGAQTPEIVSWAAGREQAELPDTLKDERHGKNSADTAPVELILELLRWLDHYENQRVYGAWCHLAHIASLSLHGLLAALVTTIRIPTVVDLDERKVASTIGRGRQ